MRSTGFSLTEIMIGVLLLSLMLLPVMTLLSQSTEHTLVSFHELRAVHYVREILDQLSEFGRAFPRQRIADLERAGGKPFPELLQGLHAKLNDQTVTNIREVRIGNTGVGLVVSPIASPFMDRYITVSGLSPTAYTSTPIKRAYLVTVGVKWKADANLKAGNHRCYEATTFLSEPP